MNFHSDASTLPSVRQARRLPAGTTLPSRAGEPGAAEEGPGLHTPRGGSGSAALSSPRQPARGPMNQRSVSAGAAASRRRGQGAGSAGQGCATAPAAPRGRGAAAAAQGAPPPAGAGRAGAGPSPPRLRGSRCSIAGLRVPLARRAAAPLLAATAWGGESERGGEGAGGRDLSLLQLLPAGGNLLHPLPPPPARRCSPVRVRGAGGKSVQPAVPGKRGAARGLSHRSLVCLWAGTSAAGAPRLPAPAGPPGAVAGPAPSPAVRPRGRPRPGAAPRRWHRNAPSEQPRRATASSLSLQVDASAAAIPAENRS